jgi:outer membrane protein insertion porin family
MDGRETIQLRDILNSLTPINARGNKLVLQFTINSQELRYPIYLKTSASIYALGFLEAGSSYADFKATIHSLSRSAGVGLRCIYACIWTSRIDFGHGFDALPLLTKWLGSPLLDNNSSLLQIFKY